MAIVYGLKCVANISVLRKLLAFAVVSLAPVVLAESAGVTLPASESVQIESLSTDFELLEDRTGALDVEAVSRAPANSGFVAGSPEKANVGFSKSAWWVRLTIHNPGAAARDLYLRQGYPLIDLLDVYQPAGGGWARLSTGDRRPFGSRPVAHRDYLFPLTVAAASQTTVYVRYSSQGPVDINLSLLDPDKLVETLSREQLAYGVYFGCVLMLLVWSGLVFVAVRDNAFLAYFGYVSVFGVYMTVNTGFAYQYFWPDSPAWANACLPVLLCLSLITALEFSTTILRARDYTPRLNLVARVLQGLAVVAIALTPFIEYAVLIKPVTFLIFVAVVFMIGLGVICLLAGSRPARFYVVAWGAFLAGSVVFLLKNFGVVSHTFMSQHAWQVGALLEMILLSMTLSSRMNELKHQSRTDPLTLLGNRRLFDQRLPIEFAQALTTHRPLTLLVLDIDNFKTFNDRFGHTLGDEAIKMVGGALRRYARKPVLACRYGGDEFCVILPGTNAEAAAAIAERLRASVETGSNPEHGITVSVGYASLAPVGEQFTSAEKLFDAADAALYSAKQAGRNRVAVFNGRRKEDPVPSTGVETPQATRSAQ
jgi:two-component system, sensor histidine kinase LadS